MYNCFSFHFLIAQGLTVLRGEDWGLCKDFLEQAHSPGHAYSPTHPQGLPEICQSFSNAPTEWSFLLSLFATTVIASGSCDGKQSPQAVFDKCPQGKGCLLWWMRSNKDKPCEQGFLGNCWTDHIMTILLEWSSEWVPTLFCPSSNCYAAAFHHNYRAVGFQSYHGGNGEKGMEIGQTDILQYCSYQDLAFFF